MKRIICFSISLLTAPLWGAKPLPPVLPVTTASSGTATGLTLDDAYRRALQTSELLALDQESIRMIEQNYRIARAAALPTIGWQRTYLIQDKQDVQESSSSVSSTLLRNTRPESYFYVRQPIFSGFREFHAMAGAKVQREQAQWQYQQAQRDLMADVADVFYTALTLQETIKVLEATRKLTQDRVEELQRRVQLGKSRDSEVLSAQVQVLSLEAQIQDQRRNSAIARETLRFLTRIEEEVSLIDTRPLPIPPTLDQKMSRLMERPDLRAAEEDRRIAGYQLKIAYGGYSPSFDVMGKYYTERIGFQEKIKWDLLFTLDVPLFEGLSTRTEIQRARSSILMADLRASRLRRQAEQQVRTSSQSLGFAISRSQAYTRAVELAERNYAIQQQEYRLGLINNLELLRLLTDLQDLRQNQVRAEANAKLLDVELKIVSGDPL